MKKIKQILAIIGVIILAGLYISTIVCAVSASENFMNMLMTSIYASVIIPVLIWAYSFIYKLIAQFNDTVGKEKQITVTATFNGSSSDLYSNVFTCCVGYQIFRLVKSKLFQICIITDLFYCCQR